GAGCAVLLLVHRHLAVRLTGHRRSPPGRDAPKDAAACGKLSRGGAFHGRFAATRPPPASPLVLDTVLGADVHGARARRGNCSALQLSLSFPIQTAGAAWPIHGDRKPLRSAVQVANVPKAHGALVRSVQG